MKRLPDKRAMLEELIAIPSMSSPDPRFDQSNRALVEKLAEWAEAIDLSIRIIPNAENPSKLNLIATRAPERARGEPRRGFIFSGHTDTVPCDPELWESDPFRLEERGGRLYGLGVADMKSFFVSALYAIAGAEDPDAPIHLVATADEESGMDGMRTLADERAVEGAYCVIGEPTELRPVRAHKGVLAERISLLGQAGHASDPGLGRSALDGMAHALMALMEYREELAKKYHDARFSVPSPTLNLGAIRGGDSPNRICGRCTVDLDLRLLPGMGFEDVRAELRKKIESVAAERGLEATLSSLALPVPTFEVGSDAALVRAAESVTGALAESVLFGTEAPFYSALGIQTIVLGAGSIRVAHQPNESIASTDVDAAIGVYSSLLKSLGISQ